MTSFSDGLNGCFYAKDVKVVKTHFKTSETSMSTGVQNATHKRKTIVLKK